MTALLLSLPMTAFGKEIPMSKDGAFTAARAQFVKLAEAFTKRPAADMNIYPQTPGDHWDRKEFAALRTGDLYAWQANADRQVVLRAFTSAGAAASLSGAVVSAIKSGQPLAETVDPALGQLLTAAALGQPTALPYADLKARLAFMFHFGKINRLCPIKQDGDTVRLRWQFTASAGGPPAAPGRRPVRHTRQTWITVDFKGGTATVSTGNEGC